jgi:hypothetical protein
MNERQVSVSGVAELSTVSDVTVQQIHGGTELTSRLSVRNKRRTARKGTTALTGDHRQQLGAAPHRTPL